MRSDVSLTTGWQLADAGDWPDLGPVLQAMESGGTWYDVQVPSGVHEVMLREGRIADPHLGRNAAEADWIGDHDWVYRTRFDTPTGPTNDARLILLGVDTLAEVWLNGRRIADLEDMFIEYVLPVTDVLSPAGASNILVIVIRSAARFVDGVEQPPEYRDHVRPTWYLRKGGGDFGSYLGARPRLVKAGIYRDVLLSLTDPAWIDDVWTVPRVAGDTAAVEIEVSCGGAASGRLRWQLLDPDDITVAGGERDVAAGRWTVSVRDPRLWWPRGHGDQPLYRLAVELIGSDDQVHDRREVTVGLREVAVLTHESDGEPCFVVTVNGRRVMLRGANWAQVEGITNVWDSARAQRLLDLAEHADMNVLRVWGGGIIPEPEFYAECNRRGLLIWQDFMFEYGMYPTDLPGYASVVERELVGVVRRLRNHPCIALWCGGNENHMGWDFQFHTPPAIGNALFDQLMPRICAEHDGTRHFHPNSPYGGPVADWPLSGDWHDYTTITYSHRSSVPTFVSEMGRVSAPSLRSMQRFLEPDELSPQGHDWSVREPGEPSWPPMWGYRSPDGAWQKIGPIEQYLEPRDAAGLIRALGTAHGEYLQASVERHRRGIPDGQQAIGRVRARRNGGDLVWRLNDPWPILYWSVIDSYLEPKIPYYYLRRSYAPVLLSFEQTRDELAIWVTNDCSRTVSGDVVVTRLQFDGTTTGTLRAPVAAEPGESWRVLETADLGPVPLRSELLMAEFGGQTVSRLLIGERYVELPNATLTVRKDDRGITVWTDVFARQVTLAWTADLDGMGVADNYFDLLPGRSRHIALSDVPGPGELTIQALNSSPLSVLLG